jgi:hypothetical protein
MTTTVLGIGLRKTPSSLSLLHEIVSLIHREMEAVNRVHEAGILSLSFQVLKNSCQSQECRNVIAKVSVQADQCNYVCTSRDFQLKVFSETALKHHNYVNKFTEQISLAFMIPTGLLLY